jgi:hypothetical protein
MPLEIKEVNVMADEEPEEISVLDSILQSTKKLLGIESDYTHFDIDLILHINSVLMGLTQMGVGPEEGFSITNEEDTWGDFLGTVTNLEGVKSYIALKVRLVFDPPTSSSVSDAINRYIQELEWRLNNQVDYLSTE